MFRISLITKSDFTTRCFMEIRGLLSLITILIILNNSGTAFIAVIRVLRSNIYSAPLVCRATFGRYVKFRCKRILDSTRATYLPIKRRTIASKWTEGASLFPITYAHLFEYPLLTYNAFFQRIKNICYFKF